MLVILVDDEPLVRDALRDALAAQADVEIVAECANGDQALDAIEQFAPHLMFLDVQMPGVTGIELAHALAPEVRPEIVFVTAHDGYAVKAFDLHAVDYVLKPFDEARVRVALERVRARLREREAGNAESAASTRIDDAVERIRAETARETHVRRLVVSLAGKLRIVPVSDVEWITADDNYVRLHLSQGTALLRETMRSIEARLDPDAFVRVHRSIIVAIDRIDEMRPLPSGDYEIRMKRGGALSMSRGYRDEALRRIAGRSS
jgi:two-component system, LytTR family, response regulator